MGLSATPPAWRRSPPTPPQPAGCTSAGPTARRTPLVLGISAGPDEYAAGVRELLGNGGIGALIVLHVQYYEGDPAAVLGAISAVAESQAKPVVASVLCDNGRLPPRTGLGVPNFLFPESCAAVLARAAARREWLSRPLASNTQYRPPDGNGSERSSSAWPRPAGRTY